MLINIGLKLKQLRIDAGITQKDLADRSHLSPSFICQIEQGKHNNIGSSSLIALAKALGIEAAILFTEIPEISDTPDSDLKQHLGGPDAS